MAKANKLDENTRQYKMLTEVYVYNDIFYTEILCITKFWSDRLWQFKCTYVVTNLVNVWMQALFQSKVCCGRDKHIHAMQPVLFNCRIIHALKSPNNITVVWDFNDNTILYLWRNTKWQPLNQITYTETDKRQHRQT